MRVTRRLAVCVAVFAWFAGGVIASADQRILVRTKKPYERVKQQVEQLGGVVMHEFKHADGLVRAN